jgi:hypothetical protein
LFSCNKEESIFPEYTNLKIFNFIFEDPTYNYNSSGHISHPIGINDDNTFVSFSRNYDPTYYIILNSRYFNEKNELVSENSYTESQLLPLSSSAYDYSIIGSDPFKNENNDYLIPVLKCSNYATSKFDSLCLLKFNKQGQFLSRKCFFLNNYFGNYPNIYDGIKVVENDGFYYFAFELGQDLNGTGTKKDSLNIYKLDLNFNFVKSIKINNSNSVNNGSFKDIKIVNDEIFLLYSNPNFSYSMYVSKYNLNLNLIASKKIDDYIPASTSEYFNDLQIINNEIFCVGYMSDDYYSHFGFLKFDNTLSPLNFFVFHGDRLKQKYNGSTVTADEKLLVYYEEEEVNSSINHPIGNYIGVSKIDPAGSVISTFKFPKNAATSYSSFCKEISENEFLLIGNKLSNGSGNVFQGFIAKVDKEGNLLK